MRSCKATFSCGKSLILSVECSVNTKLATVVNPQRACAARATVVAACVCVCVCVCLSVKSHLISGASVCCKNAVTYSAGNEDQNICGVFSETAPLRRSSAPSLRYDRPFFLKVQSSKFKV